MACGHNDPQVAHFFLTCIYVKELIFHFNFIFSRGNMKLYFFHLFSAVLSEKGEIEIEVDISGLVKIVEIVKSQIRKRFSHWPHKILESVILLV